MQKARRHPTSWTPTACKRMVSGSFHSPSWGSFHLSLTVLVRYRSLKSIQPQRMVPLDSDRVSPAPPYSGSCQSNFFTCTGLSPSLVGLSRTLPLHRLVHIAVLQPPVEKTTGFGLFRVRSPLLAESLLFSLPPGTQMFQFPGFASFRILCLQHSGLPHSEIYGSKIICISPQLIAAYHVLHRL